MTKELENNKRIAKNTLYLYIRMFIIVLIGLYTSRVVLNILGVSDYGVYNVMGGVIGMLAYVNQLFAGASSRFLTIDLGRDDFVGLKQTFSMLNSLAIASGVIILVLGETIGLWFVNTQLNIDIDRMVAANWVYQCALISCFFTVLQNPFMASFIAHEQMNVYAFFSVFDAFLKLLVAFGLSYVLYDKLIVYSLLMLLISLLGTLLCFVVGLKINTECRLSFSFNRSRFNEMFNYSGWNMIGAFAGVLNNYGLNILLNIFFGTVVNAARGIAFQVSNIVKQFSTNFQTASNPQIIKYYAEDNVIGMTRLICNTSKYSAYLLLCLIIPVVYNIDSFLVVWLGQNPEYTSWFTRVILFQILFEAIDLPIGAGIHAVGRMKLPNLTSAIIYLCVFPLSYIAFEIGTGPILGYCVYMISTPLVLIIDLMILKKYSGFCPSTFVKTVLLPVLVILVVSNIFSLVFYYSIRGEGLMYFVIRSILCFFSVCVPVYFWGLSNKMKQTINNRFRSVWGCQR